MFQLCLKISGLSKTRRDEKVTTWFWCKEEEEEDYYSWDILWEGFGCKDDRKEIRKTENQEQIRSGTTKHNWKRNQGREHESEGERGPESKREHEGEKEGEAKREQTTERASQRAREGRKNPQPVPASLYRRNPRREGTGDPPWGRMKNGLNRKQTKKHEDLNFCFSGSVAYSFVDEERSVSWMNINNIFVSSEWWGGSPRPVCTPFATKPSLSTTPSIQTKTIFIYYHPSLCTN